MKNDFPELRERSTCPGPGDIAACVAGELGIEAQQGVEQHVLSCRECRQLIDELRATSAELHNHASLQCPDLTSRIMEQIPESGWVRRVEAGTAVGFSFNQLLRLAACFVALAGAAAGIWLWRHDIPGAGVPVVATGDVRGGNAAAVRGTLRWLASVQEPSGRWDSAGWGGKKEYALALNGLALLTFARNAEGGKAHSGVIERAVKYMVSQQKESGLFGEEVEGMMYNHGIVTVALLETYAGNRDPALKPSLDKAVSYIRKQQLSTGGWGYANRREDAANTSVAVWQLQALLLSTRLGWIDEGQSLRKGMGWLGSMIDDGGQFGYERPRQSPEGTATLTAMGALCMFTASEGELPGNKALLLRLRQAVAASDSEISNNDYYRAYFRAAALKAAKTVEYDRMLADVQRSVLVGREKSGRNAGSWGPGDRWGSVGGRIYSTAVAALTLELN